MTTTANATVSFTAEELVQYMSINADKNEKAQQKAFDEKLKSQKKAKKAEKKAAAEAKKAK